jgi:threonine/homoserine/homoserine lactone efflux protein
LFVKGDRIVSGSLWAFLAVSILVIVTPGPDTLITIRSALAGGRACCVATAIGVATGQIIWALATSMGLIALLLASELVFNVIKLAGAAYLVWLGVYAIAQALRSNVTDTRDNRIAGERLQRMQAFRYGLFSNLGNPKMAVFFASVLPQFAQQSAGMLSTLLFLSLIFAAMTLTWLVLYGVVITIAGWVLQRAFVKRSIEGVTGGILVLFGLRLASEQR